MVRGRYKSRTFRRVYKRLPGSKTKLFYLKRKPSKPECGRCGAALKGVLRERPYKMSNMAKTKKVPSRAFAGNLCSRCMRDTLKSRVRSM